MPAITRRSRSHSSLLRSEVSPGPGLKPEAEARPRGRPRDPKVDQAILAATMELLASDGYARLTMERVAERARVSKASLYLRWPNKVSLVAEAMQARAQPVPEVPDTGSLGRDMRTFLRSLLRSRRTASEAMAAVTGEVASNPELNRAWHLGVSHALTGAVRAILARAVERGELPGDSDLDLLSVLPLALLQYRWLDRRSQPTEALLERMVRQFYSPLGETRR